MQNYILGAALAYHALVEASQVTVTVSPPADSCCSTEWDDDSCNPIQDAIKNASTDQQTIIEIQSGLYCNKGYHITDK